MLAGILLSEQSSEDMGNLWVWPGTHLTHETYFRKHGPEALLESKGYPPIELPAPRQILGHAGDLLLSHYMLGHNIGGNTSSIIRKALYFRLMREGHRERWRDCIRDAMLEFDAVRAALA
jgi:ectoine hydroxylase-related dioxygenase (phytanoyl-CoA dioxygenase family)